MYTYHDLPLKIYFDIAESGNLDLLIKDAKATKEDLSNMWESIIKNNSQETGNFTYLNYLDALKAYEYLLRTYLKVKACLMKLARRCDYATIKILSIEGYQISIKASEYSQSLFNASRKSDNLVTKIKARLSEMQQYRNEGNPTSFEKALAGISYGSGFQVDRQITLCGYNELIKLIKTRSKNNGRRNK